MGKCDYRRCRKRKHFYLMSTLPVMLGFKQTTSIFSEYAHEKVHKVVVVLLCRALQREREEGAEDNLNYTTFLDLREGI